jgi:WD40 repeat protein
MSPDGTMIASVGYDKRVRIFDRFTREEITVIREHKKEVRNKCEKENEC